MRFAFAVLFLIKQKNNASNEEKEEESSDISEGACDASDSEDSQNTEQLPIPTQEAQETEVKSCDVERDTADLSAQGDSEEFKSTNSASVPDQQSGEEIETVSVGAKSQLFGDRGIFGGSRAYEEKRAGPMITEIVMDTGNSQIKRVYVTSLRTSWINKEWKQQYE